MAIKIYENEIENLRKRNSYYAKSSNFYANEIAETKLARIFFNYVLEL